MSRGIQCSGMSLLSVCWTLFKSASIWDSFDLDCILRKEDLLFKSLNNYRYLGMADLPQESYTENSAIKVKFLNNRTGEITAGAYLVSITEIVSDCQQIGTGALLFINNYILGLLWGNQYFFLFDSHSKDEIGRVSATGTAVLLKFAVTAKLFKISILLRLPNDSLFPNTIFKSKMHRKCKKYN